MKIHRFNHRLTTVSAYLVYIKGHPIMSIYILKSIEPPKTPHSILSTDTLKRLIVSKRLSYWVPVEFFFLGRRQY